MGNISSEQKQELSSAIEAVIDLCNKGMHPNDAIIKTAQTKNLSEDRLPILVRIYNTGAMACQRENNDSVLSKTAEFPIADINTIRHKLYPAHEKKASYAISGRKDNTFHLSATTLFGDTTKIKNTRPLFEKSAAKAPVFRDIDRSKLVETTFFIEDRIKKAVDQASTAKEAEKDRFEASIEKLAEALIRQDTPDLTALYKMADAVYSHLGTGLLDYTLESYPHVKKAVMQKKASFYLRKGHPFYNCIEDAVAKLSDYTVKSAEYEAVVQNSYDTWKPIVAEQNMALHGSEMHQLVTKASKQASVKKAAPLDCPRDFSKLDHMLHPEWQGATEREYGMLYTLQDPEHEASLRKIKLNTLLADLINTDDFLRHQDKEAILDAYNDIVSIYPDIKDKKPLIRKALKEYLATDGLDMASLLQLSDSSAKHEEAKARERQSRIDSSDNFYRNLIDKQRYEIEQEQRAEDIAREIAERAEDIRLRREEAEAEREFTGAQNEARLASQEREGRLNRRSQANDSEEARALQKAIAEANLRTQKEENKLTRDAQADENDKTRTHQSDENEKTRTFQAGENDKTRTHQTNENEKTRTFQSGENEKTRTFQAGENDKTRTFQAGENDKTRTFQTNERLAGEAFRQGESQLNRDAARSLADEAAARDFNRTVTQSYLKNYDWTWDPDGYGNFL